jgi:hypothetical protein
VLHAPSGLEGEAGHVVSGHAIEKLFGGMTDSLEKALSLFFFAHFVPLPPINDGLTDAFDKTTQVGPITLTQQATLPAVDGGDDIGQESHGIVGRQDGEANDVAKGDQCE